MRQWLYFTEAPSGTQLDIVSPVSLNTDNRPSCQSVTPRSF